MKFIRKQERWSNERFVGKSKGFIFTYTLDKNTYYVCITGIKKDISYNSLWENKLFESKEQVELFCENFDYTKHKCLGRDI